MPLPLDAALPGPDAAPGTPDAATAATPDAGTPDTGGGGDCGCRVGARREPPAAALLVLALVALPFGLRRRRRR
jgi:MYXO-CTERM domain-containing protein